MSVPEQNAAWLARLKAIECQDATFPADPALIFDKGEGCYVFDVEGRRYLDLCAGFGALPFGHNPPYLRSLLAARTGAGPAPVMHGMGDVYPSKAKVALLERLIAVTPSHLERGALALTGAQAVELAVKTAVLATGRAGFITLEGGYHGLDLGILPLTARADFRKPFAKSIVESSVVRVPLDASEADLAAAADELDARGFGLAGVLVEPIQGRAGIRPLGEAFLRRLHDFAKKRSALLIFDEVFTGLGRAGRLWHADLVPCDLLCLGKALGGGMPVSACLGTEEAFSAWPASRGEAIHTGTFFGHPLGCEVALATLDRLIETKAAEQAAATGAQALARLEAAFAASPRVRAVRGVGLMLAVDFHESLAGAHAMDTLRSHGIISLASGDEGRSISFTPPLDIPVQVLDEAILLAADLLS